MNDNFDALVAEVVSKMIADYASWSERALSRSPDEPLQYAVERADGKNYVKLIHVGMGGSRSVAGFIVKKDTKKFKRGDLLKAASWKAPATNFARGNLFDNMPEEIRWTGIA